LHIDGEIRRAIEQFKSAEKIRETAAGAGMTTLYDNCRSLVLGGVTSIQEMVNTVYAGS
jgi:type IV pilus assembly protein PilB